MKLRLKSIMTAMIFATGMANTVKAELIIDNAVSIDGASYNLIYDTTLDITWLDYTNDSDTWASQTSWAESLNFTVNGFTYCDWRLPETLDGEYLIGYDSTSTAGWNITSSEMGHLFYEELGNIARVGTSGTIQEGSGLIQTGPFENLNNFHYWSETTYSFDSLTLSSWRFSFIDGGQYIDNQGNSTPFGIAVHSGRLCGIQDTIPAPEPLTAVLLGSGLCILSLSRSRFNLSRGIN